MLGWLLRLLVIGGIAAGVAFAASKLMNQDEDFDDFDDLDDAFEFQETPVEIEVPAGDSATSAGNDSGSEGATALSDVASNGAEASTDKGLQSISGIGSAYEARLSAIGIENLSQLASANAESLNEQFDVPGGAETLQDWISQAKELTSAESSSTNNGRDNS